MLEVEAKFQVTSPQIFDQIRLRKQVAGYTLSDQRNIPQQDTYLDTMTGLFLRNGASLRLRKKFFTTGAIEARTQLVTFKTQAKGVYTRTELEMPITDQQAQALLNGNFERVHVAAVEATVNYLQGEKAFPVLHVENLRETWCLNGDSGCIEVCFDAVRYADMDRTQSVQEYGVELELKTGEPVFLQQIADKLSKQYNLIPIFQSKYERGAALLNVFTADRETKKRRLTTLWPR